MIACVVCYVIGKRHKTKQRNSDNMTRARSDQLLHAMLERSINNPGNCLPPSSIHETCHLKETSTIRKNQIPSFDSSSDLESIC